MKKILNIVYIISLSIFEFIIDLLIIFLSVIILIGIFNENIYVNSIILLIVLCGLIYGVNDIIEVYNENKNKLNK